MKAMTDLLPVTLWVVLPILMITWGIWALLRSAERTLVRDGHRPTHRVSTFAGFALLGWAATALLLGWIGIFEARASTRVPLIVVGIALPLIAGSVLLSRSTMLRRVLDQIPPHRLVAIQVYRVLGCIFLVLYSFAMLPGVFALPAGVGDVAVGLAAPVVAYLYAAGYRRSCLAVLLWNVIGVADLALAVALGFLSSPGPFQLLALETPNFMITAFPLVLIPAFAVPLSILLHLASLRALRQTVRKTHSANLRTVCERARLSRCEA